MLLRPVEHLLAANKFYPETTRLVDEFRAERGKSLPAWPDWCFLPMSGWYAIVSQSNQVSSLPLHLVGDVAYLAAIGTWRYSQGIYRIDSDLMTALLDSPATGDLPSEVFFRLPEWCIYIETPDYKLLDDVLYGFWVHLEWDVNTKKPELRFLLDSEKTLLPLPLHIGAWTVTEAVDRAISESKKQAQQLKIFLGAADDTANMVQAIATQINPLVSLVLYLCSEEPEVESVEAQGTRPSRPQPKKTKRGWRLFPADKPKIWEVGSAIGKQLRAAKVGDITGRTVKTHMRRGHWHGYWTGAHNSQRKFIYRWVAPLVVGGNKEGQLKNI